MVNAHNHSNENWFRGMWDNLPLEPWMLFSYPVLAAPAQSPDEIYLRTVLGAIEQLRSGATCVVDFLYELDGFTDESLDAVVRAYRDVGLRALIALGIGDRAYHETVVLDEGLVSPELVERVTVNGRHLREGLRRVGYDIGPSETPIVPILIGDERRMVGFWNALLEKGVYTNASIFPAVPRGAGILRTSAMATHHIEQIDTAVEIMGELGRQYGILSS